MSPSYRTALFYRLRLHDPELANAFALQCPEVATITELNRFFHRVLSQMPCDTYQVRSQLDDQADFESWYRDFEVAILPILKQHWLPNTPCQDPYCDDQGNPLSTAQIPLSVAG